ncbi:AbrB/MazE/SpoVT family DNA-binding domain-containing protein [Paenibacillus silvae]|nr:AbrB/MazE/SpoVT family DNA-binding domain-containing protein [Paenibacillus silvae]
MSSEIGLVRRVDGLGRVVIPKTLREMMHINQDDPLEIVFDYKNEQLVIKKYEIEEV